MSYTPEQIAARYPEISAFTFRYEGGYVDHPNDPGGCTNRGITIGTLRDWRGDQSLTCADVKALTEEEAAEIYAENYWAPVWGDKLPIGVNCQTYDWGVNSGPSRSVKALQQIVGSTADGIMGKNTLAAVEAYVAASGVEGLLHKLHAKRQSFYEGLSTWPSFGKGWTARNDACLELSLQLAAEDAAATDVTETEDDRISALEKRVEELEKWRASTPNT